MGLAFDRESSDFSGVNVEWKEIFDLNSVSMPGLALSAPGQVCSGVVRSDIMIGVFAAVPLAVVPEKNIVLRLLGRPSVGSVLSSSDISQAMPVLALSASGRMGS